jgi:hypothetical protein
VTGPAATLPIIDLHLHLDGWDIPGLVKLFGELGVARAGNGMWSGSDRATLDYAQQYSAWFLPFGGERAIEAFMRGGSEQAWNLEDPAVLAYLDQLEADLRAGRFEGIGELLPNSRGSSPGLGTRYPADSPLMQRLWALSATYQVPLSVHMDATEDSVAEMERLLASDRQGTWIWAHTGWFAEPPLLRRLLEAHPNLFCELSWRVPTGGAGNSGLIRIVDLVNFWADEGRLRPEWKELLEEFPDRFVIGTDAITPTLDTYARVIGVWRLLLAQLSPETAAMLAHRNAERLLGLVP